MNISKRILMQRIVGVITAAYLRSALGQQTAAFSSQLSSPEIKSTFPLIPILAPPVLGAAPGAFETTEGISFCLPGSWPASDITGAG